MSYPAWWNKDITLYNRYEGKDGTVKWYKSIISGCFVKNIPSYKVSSGKGAAGSQNIVRIRKSDKYMPPEEWTEAQYRELSFTLNGGDIVIVGNVSDIIDEYHKGNRSSDILQKYSTRSFVVGSVSVNDFGSLAHYMISG